MKKVIITSGLPASGKTTLGRELASRCNVEVAVERFLKRKRHPGNMDHLKNSSMLKEQFSSLQSQWPLRFGKVIEVETSGAVNVGSLSDCIGNCFKRNF